jgi:hypothetical protein
MISLTEVVRVIFYLCIGAVVFGLLYWLVGKLGAVVGEGSEPFVKGARIVLLILGVFAVIGILLSLVGGQPIFRP